jgi:hypothetical protein
MFRRGILLLTSKNTQVLGGYADNLFDQHDSLQTTLGSLLVIDFHRMIVTHGY